MPITDADRAAAIRANAEPITAESLTGAVLDRTIPDVKNVLSARVRKQNSDGVIAEAVRTGKSPSQVVDELLTEALAARQAAAGVPKIVDAAVLHRLIDSIAKAA